MLNYQRVPVVYLPFRAAPAIPKRQDLASDSDSEAPRKEAAAALAPCARWGRSGNDGIKGFYEATNHGKNMGKNGKNMGKNGKNMGIFSRLLALLLIFF